MTLDDLDKIYKLSEPFRLGRAMTPKDEEFNRKCEVAALDHLSTLVKIAKKAKIVANDLKQGRGVNTDALDSLLDVLAFIEGADL